VLSFPIGSSTLGGKARPGADLRCHLLMKTSLDYAEEGGGT
jgi:hypothetical protein